MKKVGCTKECDIEGTWELKNLIGTTCKIRSIGARGDGPFITQQEVIVDNIYFRVSVDGKLQAVILFKEFPDRLFNIRDIEVLRINACYSDKAICGEFLTGNALVGYDTDLESVQDLLEEIEKLKEELEEWKTKEKP